MKKTMKYHPFCIAIAWVLTGCIYDPPTGSLDIFNNSDSAVYVYETYDDSLSMKYGLSLFISAGGQDACGQPMPDTTAPGYRVNAYSWQSFQGFGTLAKPRFDNGRDKLTLYFIREITMRTKSWKEVCEGQLYERKMAFTGKQLDSLCWRIVYRPDEIEIGL